MKYAIWYMAPAWFRQGISGERPNPADLGGTHVHLMDIEAATDTEKLDEVFASMQGERWSPNGEARATLQAKGLEHTSMSVGDVIVVDDERAYVVARFGFDRLYDEPAGEVKEDYSDEAIQQEETRLEMRYDRNNRD
jgi:hypothetical protein